MAKEKESKEKKKEKKSSSSKSSSSTGVDKKSSKSKKSSSSSSSGSKSSKSKSKQKLDDVAVEVVAADVAAAAAADTDNNNKSKKSSSSSSSGSSSSSKPKITRSRSSDSSDNALHMDKLMSSTGREYADAEIEEEDDEEVDDDVDVDELKPIPIPNNEPMECITLVLKQPNLERLTMTKIDPANTTIRMIRDFLFKQYYKNNVLPRIEQRQLLYRLKPIFDIEGDYNIDDAKTLADHGIIKDNSIIELSKMHVYVISPSDGKSMMINNIDPMNDVIFDMKKLAYNDGYPIEKLRLLHKEANNREIQKSQNEVTFFNCGVKHNHTLILEWPKITVKIKLPICRDDDIQKAKTEEGKEIIQDPITGRYYVVIDFVTRTELDKVQSIHDFITQQTGIVQTQQTLFSNPKTTPAAGKKNATKKVPKTRFLKDPLKVIADYKIEENDIIELEPMSVKINLLNGTTTTNNNNNETTSETKVQTILDYVYPNDTIQFIKDQIQNGKGIKDGIKSIPSTNLSLYQTKNNNKELKWDYKQLQKEDIQHLDELDIEQTKITIKVKLPGPDGKIIDIGINPKLDDIETVKDQLADKTGLPKEFFPPLRYKDDLLDDDDDDDDDGSGKTKKKKKKLAEYNILESDIIDMEPMKLNVNVVGTDDTVCIDNIDPFNDTIDDIKKRLGPDDLDILPVDKQRLLFMDVDLDDGDEDDEATGEDDEDGNDDDNDGDEDDDDDDDDDKKKKKKKQKPSPSSRKLFECNIKNLDTIDLEKSKIDVQIKQPNGEVLELENVDPRKDTVKTIEDFLSDKYYRGKDKDGTIPNDQLRPLKFEGKQMKRKDTKKSLRDYGITDDGKVVELEPMTVHVIVGAPDDNDSGDSSNKTKVLDNVDPMNDRIQNVKDLGVTDDTPVDLLILRHKESKMKEIENNDDKQSFYDNGVKEGDTLVVQRKPITIRVKLPIGSKIKDIDDEDPDVEVINGNDDGAPILSIKLDPDADDFDAIRKRIFDYVGVPIDSQKLNKIIDSDDGGSANEGDDDDDDEGSSRKQRLDAPGKTKLSSPELKLVGDCTIELDPMTLNIKTNRGTTIPLKVLPSDTIEDVKKKLAKDKISIPYNKQRLLTDDGIEFGGDEENENSNGSDKSTLMMLGVEDGDTFSVEKSKITLKVNMPKGMDDVEVLVDPRNDGIDRIRQFIFDATGLPKEHQQRLKFNDELLDGGFKGDDSGADDGDAGAKEKRTLENFNLKEFDCITLDSVQVYIMRIPEKEQFLIEDVDLMNNTLQDLKKRVAAEIQLPTFKQRLLNSETDEEYIGNKDSTETLHDYLIKDGDVINLEKAKINLRIILPNLDELDLTVDPRKDDLQMVRDHIFKRYYNKREVPKKDLRHMLRGASKVLNDEPGEKKLIEFGIIKDDDHVKLKPCCITIITPKKKIFCPNADPFHDTLTDITKFIEHLKIPVDGLRIEFKGKTMSDYETVLYDLDISDDSTLEFLE